MDHAADHRSELDVFRDNLRHHLSEWRNSNGGKSLGEFAEMVFPGRDKFRWLSELLEVGVLQKAGQATESLEDLETLHRVFGLASGDLWSDVSLDSLRLNFGALLEELPRMEHGNALRQTIADQIEKWRSMKNSVADNDDPQSVLLFSEMTGNEAGRIIKALASPNFSWPSDPATFCNKFKQRHPRLWARLVADTPEGEKGAVAVVAHGLHKFDPEIVYLKLMKRLPALPEPWPSEPAKFVERFRAEHPELWRRLVAAEKRFGEKGAYNCLKRALRDVQDPNKVYRMAIEQLEELPVP